MFWLLEDSTDDVSRALPGVSRGLPGSAIDCVYSSPFKGLEYIIFKEIIPKINENCQKQPKLFVLNLVHEVLTLLPYGSTFIFLKEFKVFN